MNPQVSKAFRQLYLGKRSGVLLSEAGQVKRSVIFKAGFIVSARSSLAADRLGEVMVKCGRITPQHLKDASIFIKSGRKLGEILVELRIVPQGEIEHYVRIQLLNVACSLVIDPPKRLAFSALSEVDSVVQTPVSVADVLMEAARRTPHVEAMLDALKKDNRKLGFASDPHLRFQNVNLTPEEAFVLSRIDGSERPPAILAVSPLAEADTARTLWGLIEAGVVELGGDRERPKVEPPPRVESPPAASTSLVAAREPIQDEIDFLFEEYQRQDHWQVLGLGRDASAEQVKHAFNEKALRYHPDRHQKVADAAFHERLSFVFNRLNEAFQTLSKRTEATEYQKLAEKEAQYEQQRKDWTEPAPAAPPEAKKHAPTKDPKLARELFLRAKRAYDAKDYWETIQLCRQAVEIANDQAEHFHLLGLALSQNPKWRADAEQNLKIATQLDPWKAEYLTSLGDLYKRGGMHLRAERMYEQARAIDPTHVIQEE